MEMFTPKMERTLKTPVSEMESKFSTDFPSKNADRLPVKRRLFCDGSPENSPPTKLFSISKELEEFYAQEKTRALRDWGFDINTDSPLPSTSQSSSQFDWSISKSSDVPGYYVRGYSRESDATFTPQKKTRFTLPTPMELPNLARSQSIPSMASEIVESTVSIAPYLSQPIGTKIASKRCSEETPLRGRKMKKTTKNCATISRQARLTDFYSQTKPRSSTSPMNKAKKRSSTNDVANSSPETSVSSSP